jgi:hypothetical protein
VERRKDFRIRGRLVPCGSLSVWRSLDVVIGDEAGERDNAALWGC